MDKNRIRKFAVSAKSELLQKVTENADKIGITDNRISEKIAYTWFIYLICIRYMDVNGVLPFQTELFYDEGPSGKEQLFYVCERLSEVLPGLFRVPDDLERKLCPDEVFENGGFLTRLVQEVEPEDWKESAEVIGWFFQFYNNDKKDEVFRDLKNGIKIAKDNIPAATQLFTPDWIVKYMVENTVGHRWLTENPESRLRDKWIYYREPNKENDIGNEITDEITNEIIDEITDEITNNITSTKEESMTDSARDKILDMKCIDPCCGAGNILAYLFDVFIDIYRCCGYSPEEAAERIVKQNIYGVDIDERAVELAYFTLMMKGCQYDTKFLTKNITPNVISLKESKEIDSKLIQVISGNNTVLQDLLQNLMLQTENAKEFGSLIRFPKADYSILYKRVKEVESEVSQHMERKDTEFLQKLPLLKDLITEAVILSDSYDVVITNPPYMGKKSLNHNLSEYLDQYYKNGKSELYSAFILRCLELAKDGGLISMITIHSWMFISSFEPLREEILSNTTILSLVHSGAATFEELNAFNVLSTFFTLRKGPISGYKGTYIRLADYYDNEEKRICFRLDQEKDRYVADQDVFYEIPGKPLVYWLSETFRENFHKGLELRAFSEPRQGLATGDNKRFVRYWFEVDKNEIAFSCKSLEEANASGRKWFPYNKGGNYRKWYGMNEYIVDWSRDGYEIRHQFSNGRLKSRPQNVKYYFESGITWSLFGFENFGVRYKENGFIFDVSGSSMFPEKEDVYYVLAFLASKVAFSYLSVLAPTVNFQVGNIGDLPFIMDEQRKEKISKLAKRNIELSKEDWDSNELSWDFSKSPLITEGCQSIEEAYLRYKEICENRFMEMYENETTINSLFISIYGLEKDMHPEANLRDISVYRIFDTKENVPPEMIPSFYVRTREDVVKSFISYAVGCMFGRYKLEGYPECRENYLIISNSDIVNRFSQFVEFLFGHERLKENLEFIARAISPKKNADARTIIGKYFSDSFYKDHLRMYKNTPIYWEITSSKKYGFSCLFCIHRYDKELLLRIYQENESIIEDESFKKTLFSHAKKKIELNLDDGVLCNYEKFKAILRKI